MPNRDRPYRSHLRRDTGHANQDSPNNLAQRQRIRRRALPLLIWSQFAGQGGHAEHGRQRVLQKNEITGSRSWLGKLPGKFGRRHANGSETAGYLSASRWGGNHPPELTFTASLGTCQTSSIRCSCAVCLQERANQNNTNCLPFLCPSPVLVWIEKLLSSS